MFISALSTSRINEAFRLCSLNDTFSIKLGEQILKEMREDRSYLVMLTNYLTDKDVGLQSHMRAALQIERAVKAIIDCELQEDRIDELTEGLIQALLNVYIRCEQQVANIIRSVIITYGISEEVITYLASNDNGSQLIKLRTLKLYSKSFKQLEDETIFNYADQLASYVLGELEAQLKLVARDEPLPTALIYEMVKILVLYTENFSSPFTDPNFVSRYVNVLKHVLVLPVDQDETKKQFKLKGKAFNCLNLLVNVTSEDMSSLIDHFKYIISIKKQSPDLMKYCLQYYLNSLKGTVQRLPPSEKQPALNEILQTAILACYDPDHMYKLLKQDHQRFIQVYFQCLNDYDCLTSTCRKIFRFFILKYESKWQAMLEAGRSGSNPTELLMCFLCESALICTPHGVIKHCISLSTIHSITREIYQKNLNTLNIQKCPQPLNLSEQQLLRVCCSLRVFCHYRNDIPVEDLIGLCMFCSKLALKNSTLQFICYYVINQILMTQNKYHTEGNRDSWRMYLFADSMTQLYDLACILLDDISTNTFALTMWDLRFVSTIVTIIAQKKDMFTSLQKPLKILSEAALCLCQNGGDESLLDKILNIPSTYTLFFHYDKDFTKPLLKIIQKKIVNEHIAEIYIEYMEAGADDPKSVAQMYKQMSSPEFWFDNKDLGSMYIPILIMLTIKLQSSTQAMSKTLTIANDVVNHLGKHGRYASCEMIGVLILVTAMKNPLLHKKIDELYEILFNNSKKSESLNCLMMTMMATYPNPRQSMRHCCIERILYALKKSIIRDPEIKELLRILFDHFEMYFVPIQPASWKKWGQLFEIVLKEKHICQNQKKQVVALFHGFSEKYKPDISKILKEKYQIILTAWMFEFSSVS